MQQRRTFVMKYNVADLFDRTIAMIGRTWKVTLGVGAPAVLIPSVLVGLAFSRMMDNIARLASRLDPSAGPESILSVLDTMWVIWAAGAVAGLLYLLAWLSVTHAVREGVFGGEASISGAASLAVRHSYLTVIGQAVLKAIVVSAIVAIPTTLLVLAVAVAPAPGFLAVLAGIAYLAGVVAAVWLYVALLFSSQAVVFDKAGVIVGLRDSMRLVRGQWWRVFAVYLLIQIIYSFVVGIVSTPFVGVSAIPAIGEIIRMSTSGPVSDAEVMEAVVSLRGIGLAVSVSVFIQQLVGLIFLPVFYGLFYVDLKVRRGELAPENSEDAE